MKTATVLRERVSPSGARQLTVTLSAPLEGHLCVVVSAVTVLGDPETYIFPGAEDGTITDWGELAGSMKGTLDHAKALASVGYVLLRP